MDEKNHVAKWLHSVLPVQVFADAEKYLRTGAKPSAEEIRLRRGRRTELIAGGTSLLGKSLVNGDALEETLFRICRGSVYAYADSICKGFIRADGGVRVGVCGSAVTEGGKVRSVYDVSSLNIRLPCAFFPDVSPITSRFSASDGGILIYSPPGVGKTTYLRALARDFSGRLGLRTALVDTRGELSAGLCGDDLRLDILDGYPRGEGIRIAVRTMNPEVLICDEIGSAEEASALLEARNCGVPLVASAHGDSACGLVCRAGIHELYEASVFSLYVGLSRGRNEERCKTEIRTKSEVENDI